MACTGVHGANRLASNSLLEGLVFGGRAAAAMCEPARAGEIVRPRARGPMPAPIAATAPPDPDTIAELMWRDVGLVRAADALTRAVATLDGWRRAAQPDPRADLTPAGALATVAWLIARGALDRRESRGGHARSDFASRDDLHWMVHIVESANDQER